jgi:hypothetical protein
MDAEEIEELARKSGMSGREYCLQQIETWKDRLETVSDDYRDLSDEEFQSRVEEELKARQQD